MDNIARRPQGLQRENLMNWVYENRAEVDKESGCILWTGPMGTMYSPSISYGKLKSDKRKSGAYKVNRLFWEFKNGEIPKGMIVGHTCESFSPNHHKCINIKHFELQTYSENMETKIISHKEKGLELKPSGPMTTLRMPTKLQHKDKVKWLLKNKTKPIKFIDKGEKTWDCLEWTGNKRNKPNVINDNGMASIGFMSLDSGQSISIGTSKTRTVSISRYILFILNNIDYLDPKNKGIKCRHKCLNGMCINPDHLRIGSQSENMLDARATHTKTKLSEDIVRLIIEDAIDKLTNKNFTTQTAFELEWVEKLSQDPYNIKCSKHAIINFLWRRITWQDVTEPYQTKLIEARGK
tara:strand:- start:16 stop:1068 length:1053 start_codon:yes stop_codon:yes gene_type:complete